MYQTMWLSFLLARGIKSHIHPTLGDGLYAALSVLLSEAFVYHQPLLR
jgi:hypothetical protein